MRLEKQVKTHRLLDVICGAVFNKFRVKLFGIAYSHVDTEFVYDLQTDEKLSKATRKDIALFIEGLETGFLAN